MYSSLSQIFLLHASTTRLLRHGCLSLLILTLAAFLPTAQAVLPPPPPDGGYPGGNTAEGQNALFSLGPGTYNTAVGLEALFKNYSGIWNTAIGTGTLHENNADANTAVGTNALWHNTESDNTGIGTSALYLNTINFRNTAIGFEALLNNNDPTNRSNSSYNTATGHQALHDNTTGWGNTANGDVALYKNKSGKLNTGIGQGALFYNTTGSNNTAIGASALSNSISPPTTGSNNIGLGYNAGFRLTGSNNIDIGNEGVAGESGRIRIGTAPNQTATFIAGIYNVSEGGTIKPVYINSTGRLGTQPPASSQRFKTDIKPMDKNSEAILALKPVTFQYKGDEECKRQFGLIAEEVAKIDQNLVVRDEKGEIYTVRYEAVNAMLLNEFLKEHCKVQELKAIVAQQQEEFHAKFGQQQKQIEALTATVQKVSDQVALSKPIPQLVINP